MLLEWVLGSYSAAFKRIENRLEEFDVNAMRGGLDGEEDIERLIDMRRAVGKLRRALAAHRPAARRAHVSGARGARRLRVR
jgi:CHAD domain-containing protein